MKNYVYQYNCVHPDCLEELEVIIDDMMDDIPFDEFAEAVSFDEMNEKIGGIYPTEDVMRKDYHVRYFIGQVTFEDDILEKEIINYAVIVHSAIEYVWKLEN